MPVVHSSLFYVFRLFPSHKEDIYYYYKENVNFKNICDDYRLCSEALKRWKQSESDVAHARIEEYAEILQGLELELSKIFNETRENGVL